MSPHDLPRTATPDEPFAAGPTALVVPAARRSLRDFFATDALRASERYCQELTRREAGNFYWGFIALPREQRSAIYALYSFAREIDDDVDLSSALSPTNNRPCVVDPERFQFHRDRVECGFKGKATDPVMHVLSDVVPRFGIPREDLDALIRGVEADLHQDRYETWDELRDYCLLVASSVGRMCVRIFGYSAPEAIECADDLGVAMQLTNILRDVREDVERGRIYLPREDLRPFGITGESLARGDPGPGWEALVAFETARAHSLFESGLRVTAFIPRRATACVLTMSGMYLGILQEIERDPFLPLRRRISLRKRAKLSVMARSWLQAM